MKSRSVLIELLPFRVDVAVFDGSRCVNARRVDLELDSDPHEWERSLRSAAPAVKAVVDELAANGLPATVLYRGQTQATELSSLEIKSSRRAAAAASLSCLDALSYSNLAAVHTTYVLGRDAAGSSQRTHVVATADRDDIVAAIAEFVQQCDLSFEGAAPMDAVVLSGLADEGLQNRTGMQARLYIGETTSFFLVARDGRLLFARRISLGLDTLVRALTRPTRPAAGNESVELDLSTARTILYQHGLPERDTIVDHHHGLTGAEVGPLLQPVFQRFMVEMRQSMRFGLDENDRGVFTLVISGPGAAVPRIDELFSGELNAACEVDPDDCQYDPAGPCSPGSELRFAARDRRVIRATALQPQQVAEQRRRSARRRWLVTGTAAALAVIAFDAARYHFALRHTRIEANAATGHAADLESLQQTAKRLQTALQRWHSLEQTIHQNVNVGFDFHAIFNELSQQTPENVKLNTIRFAQRDGKRVGTIAGYVLRNEPQPGADDASSATDSLQQFIKTLRRSPLFEDVALGTVQQGRIGTYTGRRFEAQLLCAPVPNDAAWPNVADAGEEHAHVAD